MAAVVTSDNITVYVEQVSDSQVSTNTATAVADSVIDARAYSIVSYTIAVITNGITWSVWGANSADFSDEVVVDSEGAVSAAASDSYAVSPAPYAYYRVKIRSTSAGNHGTATVNGIAKR